MPGSGQFKGFPCLLYAACISVLLSLFQEFQESPSHTFRIQISAHFSRCGSVFTSPCEALASPTTLNWKACSLIWSHTAVIAQRWTMNQSCTALCHLSYCCDKWWNFALLVTSLLPKGLYYALLAFLCMLDKLVLYTVQEVSKYLPPFPISEGVVWHFVSAGVLPCSYWAFLPTDSLAL